MALAVAVTVAVVLTVAVLMALAVLLVRQRQCECVSVTMWQCVAVCGSVWLGGSGSVAGWQCGWQWLDDSGSGSVWLLAVLAFLPVMHVLLGIFDCTKVAVAVDGTGSGTETKTV
jgi:hypothetical protein